MHAIMKHWHPMIGRDLHIPWPPGSPAPAPSPVPYVTASTLLGLGITALYAPTHMSQGMGMTMNMGTDIGPMIPHVGAPSNLLPIEIPLSSSKSYFGPSNHLAGGKPIAAGLLGNTNPNLNCGTPVPVPFGEVIVLNTHYVGMSLADILGGMAAMASDFAIQSILQVAGGRLSSRVGSAIARRLSQRVFQRSLFQGLMRGDKWAQANAVLRQMDWDRRAPDIIGEVFGQVQGFWTGGPMGADAGTFGLPTAAGDASDSSQEGARGLGESAGEAIDDYLNDDGVEDLPMGDYPETSGSPMA